MCKNQLEIKTSFEIQNIKEVQELFEQKKLKLGVHYDIECLLANTHLYCVFSGGILMSCVYFFCDKDLEKKMYENYEIQEGGDGQLLFMNGFSKRKFFKENLLALKTVIKFYSQKVYAYTSQKAAGYVLASSGFAKVKKKLSNNIEKKFNLFEYTHN